MANHKQPTKEELKAGMAKSLEDLKNLPPEGEPPVVPPVTPPSGDPPVVPPTPPVKPPESTPPATPPEGTPPAKKEGEGEPPVVPPVTPKPPVAPGQTDWEKKFKESSREAQVIGFKNKEVNKAIEDAGNLPSPTEEEMKGLYPNWDEIDVVTKGIAVDNLLNKRKFDLIHNATAKFKDVDAWNEKVDTFANNPATLADHPELEGKQEEFKTFASKPTRRGLEFDDLLLAFAGEQAKTPPVHHEGEMFPQGSGGPATPPKPADDKLTLAQGEQLRKADYKKFLELLKADKIAKE